MKTVTEIIVEKLRTYMNEQQLTQYALAQKSNVPFPTLKSILQGRTKDISLKTTILLAHGLGYSVSEFLSGDAFAIENLLLE